MGIFFVVMSEYKIGRSSLLFQEELYNFEYVLQGFTALKLILLSYMLFVWVYANFISKYDIYLYSRFSPFKVCSSKFLVLNLISFLMAGFLTVLFAFVWLLYPMALKTIIIVELFGYTILFVVLYNVLFFLFLVLFKHLYGLFIPLFGYLFSMISMDMNSLNVLGENGINYSQILFPDIVYHDNHFMFMYGGLFVFCELLFCGFIVIHIFRNNDLF